MLKETIDNPRPIFYYLRNENNQPVITICLIKHGDSFSRGVAICSPRDQLDKAVGQYIAHDRAEIGVKILVNSEKLPTAKQIRLGRRNQKYICIEKIKRQDAVLTAVFLSETAHLPDGKITTFPESKLTMHEKELLTKIKRQ